MSYLAMYRKYRSRTFDEVVGQEHVTNTLKNQISNDKFAHAYLLCGIRGVGKTSIARILAKAVNCENNKDGNPCLECSMCKEIDSSSNLNVIEIDAASNTGVDNIKEIRDDATYLPSKGKYKVYIIDEIHMLSTNAFNALLKILEEPPKHVIFIFATTESQKIPATILSRCQRFDLKRIARDAMIERLTEYLKLENLKVEDKAVRYIVSLSEGSMRDALSILEQVISIKKGEEVTLEDILNTLGNVDYNTFHNLTLALSNNDVTSAIEIVNKIYEDGKEIRNFVMQYITYLRNLLLIINSSSAADILDMSKENIEEIKNLSKTLSSPKVIEYIETLSKTEVDMRYSNMPKLSLEITIIKLCEGDLTQNNVSPKIVTNANASVSPSVATSNSFSIPTEKSVNINEVSRMEEKTVNNEVKIENLNETKKENSIEIKTENKVIEDLSNDENKAWRKITESADMFLKINLEKTRVTKVTDNEFYVLCENEITKEYVEKKNVELSKKLNEYGITGKRLIFYVSQDLKNNENVNNAPKKDNTNIDELAGNLANLGINVNIE